MQMLFMKTGLFGEILNKMSIGTFLLITTGLAVLIAVFIAVRKVKKILDKQEEDYRAQQEAKRKKTGR